MKEMTNKYDLMKTIKFELVPMGKTVENIKENGIFDIEEAKYEASKKLKLKYRELFEDYIKSMDLCISDENLKEYLNYRSNSANQTKGRDYELLLLKLASDLYKSFDNKYIKENLLGKNSLVTLKEFLNFNNEYDCDQTIELFKKDTNYFNDYFTKNMFIFSNDLKKGTIVYRTVIENLDKFYNNIDVIIELIKIDKSIIEDCLTGITEYMGSDIGIQVKDLISIEGFNKFINQSGIDLYNNIINGVKNKEIQVQGLRNRIVKYNQQNKTRIKNVNELFKQILVDKESKSFKFEEIETDNDLINVLTLTYDEFKKYCDNKYSFQKFINNIDEYNTSDVFLNTGLKFRSINSISNYLFGDFNKIKSHMLNRNGNEDLKEIQYISYKELDDLIKEIDATKSLVSFFNEYAEMNDNFIMNINDTYKYVMKAIDELDSDEKIAFNDNVCSLIKDFYSMLNSIHRMYFKFIVPKDKYVDNKFIEVLKCLEGIELFNTNLNISKNYLTKAKKLDRNLKLPLMFGSSTFLDGWSKDKEKSNLGIFLKKEDTIYLAILRNKFKKVFDENIVKKSENVYEKMNYEFIPTPYRMFPKVFIKGKNNYEKYKPTNDLIKNYDLGKHKKGDNFDLNYMHELIDFYKECIKKHESWSKMLVTFSDTDSYNDISEFYKEVEKQAYKIDFNNCYDCEYVNKLVDENKLYLFRLHNKDFNTYAKGNKNLHTIYWNALFSEENSEKCSIKLNGNAQVFFRSKVFDPGVKGITSIHKKNEDINCRILESKSRFNYDIVKNKRYTSDKFHINVPITINYHNENCKNINSQVNDLIKNGEIEHIIGIDRGERNLIYVSVINKFGEIVETKSYNKILSSISDNKVEINYHEKLDTLQKDRNKSKQNWGLIDNIKELKMGYLSQVVNEIVKLVLKYNAVIVFEDLNISFKNNRKKIEKEVYQKFENALINKLQYVVLKNKNISEPLGALNGLQLVNKNGLNRYQNGIIFYVSPWNTSKIDPTTGFTATSINFKYENISQAKELISRFDGINYDKSINTYSFKFDGGNFAHRTDDGINNWEIFGYGNRLISKKSTTNKQKREIIEINLNEEFLKLFEEYNLNNDNLKDSILEINSAKFFEKLFELLRYTLQIRNSKPNDVIDYMISCVKNDTGEFYDSRKGIDNLPADADANGAYNIARKGLLYIDKIIRSEDDETVKLAISNEEWLKYATKNRLK